MEFLITQFIYPLEKRFLLSDHLGFYFDNPRTDLEISVVEDYLIRAYESGYDYKFPVFSDESSLSIEDILFNFRNALVENDEYVKKIFETYKRDNVFEFLSKIWIIARFDDKGMGDALREEYRKMREKEESSFFLLDDDHPLLVKSKALADYCSLLSILIQSEGEDYFGRQVILDTGPLDPKVPVQRVWNEFLMLGMILQTYPDNSYSLNWVFFPYIREKVSEVAAQLDKVFKSDGEDKLLYIGSIIKVASQRGSDIRTRIVLLTSILELLLTHNPDFSRYNVEDSINKQFQLKASLLIYLNDKSRDINAIKKRLRTIYTQRSNIAHGNFKAFEKYENNLNKNEGNEEYIDDLVTDLYQFIRAVVEEYLKDNSLVEFLKKG